ncbi:Fic family protein [Cupriavidus plantarum]|uniref:Fic family protein n=1 Tax=Cupriavidus plantarum TaxID=942865 RepID=UPI00339D5CF6
MSLPLGARDPVTYHRDFVDAYRPNESYLLPQRLADELYQAGRLAGQQPAGTYARKVFEQLLIDLSWSSSRLEGNRYTLLATKELFERGVDGDDTDAVMLLNHKRAIEYLVEGVPTEGLTTAVLRNLHATLMEALLANDNALGTIRGTVVNISDTVYVPAQVPAVLHEMLQAIVDKARLIKNPVEGAFFLWVNVAYLQPFEDGNKRTSRLAANIPLMLYNCAPLAFLDVDPSDYAQAMLGIYALQNAAAAVDLFAWTYRRSIKKYAVVKSSFASPDPRRLRYRPALEEAVRMIVLERQSAAAAVEGVAHTEDKAPGFAALLAETLQSLGEYNCARFRLTSTATREWVEAGRPM